MQRQHQQLHTHEKILRYELSQKRKMLTELKQELEYCREKWVQAREKNSSTEEQWKQLRSEFALRKVTTVDDLNNSGESGYSDERECSSDDESTYETNKNKKLLPVTKIASDTEDNDETSHGSDVEDLLETAFSKACSSSALQQPNLKLSDVFVLNPDIPLTLNSNDTEETSIHTCDNKIETNFSECSSTELHSTEKETETQVQTPEDINSSQKSIDNNIIDIEIPSSSHENTVQTQKEDISQDTEQINSNTISDLTEKTNEDLVVPSTSQSTELTRTSEEILSKREERLRRLEEQCKLLVTKVTNTTHRGAEISSRLTTLHEQYGSTSENTQNQESSSQNEENPENIEEEETEN